MSFTSVFLRTYLKQNIVLYADYLQKIYCNILLLILTLHDIENIHYNDDIMELVSVCIHMQIYKSISDPGLTVSKC